MRTCCSCYVYRYFSFRKVAKLTLIPLSGSILSCFLSRDGGPRDGAIRLLPEKIDVHLPIPEEESTPPSPVFEPQEPRTFVGSLQRKVSKKLSGYLAQRVPDAHSPGSPPSSQPALPMSVPGPRLERTRTFSRTSRANGSAYGYTGSTRNRLASNATTVLGARRPSMASSMRRRGSNFGASRDGTSEGADLNFAQRLLMANENAVTNIADLWVAAAMNVDNEDPFETDTETGSDGDANSLELGEVIEDDENDGDEDGRGRPDTRLGGESSAHASPAPHFAARLQSTHRLSNAGSSPRPHLSRRVSGGRHIPIRPSPSFSQPMDGTPASRRFSSSVPSIFAHPGVKTPTAVIDAQQLLARSEADLTPDSLAPIPESRRVSQMNPLADVEAVTEKPPSLTSQLPLLIIVQYGFLALHTNMHDQIFMSYLVS